MSEVSGVCSPPPNSSFAGVNFMALYISTGPGEGGVMDGLAQTEYAHRTVLGLQGPRVNLTYRWVTQHTPSCPLAGVVGRVLPSCVQGLAELGSPGWR